jgi:signal transduction histidine kinase
LIHAKFEKLLDSAVMTIASDALKRKSEVVMKHFEERARREVESAFRIDSLQLQDALPRHLELLSMALAAAERKKPQEIVRATAKRAEVGKEHGHDRATGPGYSLEEVIFEYRILRQVILQVLGEEVKLSAVELEIITDFIEQAVTDAAVEFVAVEQESSERFTAVLSHDLRGPITAARMNAEMIVRGKGVPEALAKRAVHIVATIDRMDLMIRNLLDAGRIKSKKDAAQQFADCVPAKIAQEVIEEMTTIHGERFELICDERIKASWNGDLYRRALENLVGNAVKYGDPKTPIQVSLRQEKDMVETLVHNQGNPIPAKELPGLFEKYSRSRSAEQSMSEGWGLGLTLVKDVVEAHRGTIEVESSIEAGTSFVMLLPNVCNSFPTDDKSAGAKA